MTPGTHRPNVAPLLAVSTLALLHGISMVGLPLAILSCLAKAGVVIALLRESADDVQGRLGWAVLFDLVALLSWGSELLDPQSWPLVVPGALGSLAGALAWWQARVVVRRQQRDAGEGTRRQMLLRTATGDHPLRSHHDDGGSRRALRSS